MGDRELSVTCQKTEGGHHDAQNLVVPDEPTLEAYYSGRLNHLFYLLRLNTFLCVFGVYGVFVFCALLSKRVCGTGKGVTGMLLFRRGIDTDS